MGMHRRSRYRFMAMAVGESIFVEGTSREIASARSAASHVGRRHGMRFVSRSEGEGIRIWRVDPNKKTKLHLAPPKETPLPRYVPKLYSFDGSIIPPDRYDFPFATMNVGESVDFYAGSSELQQVNVRCVAHRIGRAQRKKFKTRMMNDEEGYAVLRIWRIK